MASPPLGGPRGAAAGVGSLTPSSPEVSAAVRETAAVLARLLSAGGLVGGLRVTVVTVSGPVNDDR